MESFIHTFNNVNEIVLKQNDMEVPINDIVEGEWKIHTINERKKLSGVYFYNPLYISQVYTNNPLKVKERDLEVCINSKEINLNNCIINNELKVYDNGFILKEANSIFISTLMGRLTGFMIVM
jgi:hypothetical protein